MANKIDMDTIWDFNRMVFDQKLTDKDITKAMEKDDNFDVAMQDAIGAVISLYTRYRRVADGVTIASVDISVDADLTTPHGENQTGKWSMVEEYYDSKDILQTTQKVSSKNKDHADTFDSSSAMLGRIKTKTKSKKRKH